MASFTIRMPDDRAERLKALAAARNISVNKLIEEWAIMGITEFDAESRFRAHAARGSASRGLELLAELDRRDKLPHPSGLHEKEQPPYKTK